jgi:hypothetical protein
MFHGKFSVALVLSFSIGLKYADADIIGAWLLDEDGTDSSGNSNDGVVTGDPEWEDGKFGQAMVAVPNKYVDFPPPTSDPMTLDDEFTVMAWLKPNQWIGGWQAAFSMQAGSSGAEIYGIYFGNAGGTEILLWTTGTSITTGAGGIDLGVWTHGAVTYDGANLVLCKNGEKVTEKAFAGPLDNKDGKGRFVINGNYNSLNGGLAEFCDSLIDEVLIFDEALSQTEIADYMNNGFEAVSGTTAVDASGKLATTWGKLRVTQ